MVLAMKRYTIFLTIVHLIALVEKIGKQTVENSELKIDAQWYSIFASIKLLQLIKSFGRKQSDTVYRRIRFFEIFSWKLLLQFSPCLG